MNRAEIEKLREDVGCAAVLSDTGFAIDEKESTRRAVKFRRGAEIIIVTHDGRGWFDPLSDAKGDVFSLVAHLESVDFPTCCERVASLVGLALSMPVLQRTSSPTFSDTSPPIDRWRGRRCPRPGSRTWQYLRWERSLPAAIIRAASDQGLLREGPCGSMWAAHIDGAGAVVGWEERGPEWRGFASGGSKTLFRFGQSTPRRFFVTEAAIDAMSLAAIEGLREGTLYLSTGGGWSPQTTEALRNLVSRDLAQLVAATDANSQGDAYAERLRMLAEEFGCQWLRLRPPAGDWNDVLKERERKNEENRKSRHAAFPPAASREASPGQGRPLTRPDGLPAAREVYRRTEGTSRVVRIRRPSVPSAPKDPQMTVPSSIRKVFQGVATRHDMFRLFDRHAQRPNRWEDDAAPLYAGEWFEISEIEHDYMFELLPPLWIRGSMFAMREYLTGSVTSVFFALRIDGRIRHFHGYCDLSDRTSVEQMRVAIIERESQPVRAMTREERVEHIWSSTADAYRSYAGERWPTESQGHRTISIYAGKESGFLKLLDDLTDDEIAAKLPVHLRHLPSPIAA